MRHLEAAEAELQGKVDTLEISPQAASQLISRLRLIETKLQRIESGLEVHLGIPHPA